jgi:hypothetical protein
VNSGGCEERCGELGPPKEEVVKEVSEMRGSPLEKVEEEMSGELSSPLEKVEEEMSGELSSPLEEVVHEMIGELSSSSTESEGVEKMREERIINRPPRDALLELSSPEVEEERCVELGSPLEKVEKERCGELGSPLEIVEKVMSVELGSPVEKEISGELGSLLEEVEKGMSGKLGSPLEEVEYVRCKDSRLLMGSELGEIVSILREEDDWLEEGGDASLWGYDERFYVQRKDQARKKVNRLIWRCQGRREGVYRSCKSRCTPPHIRVHHFCLRYHILHRYLMFYHHHTIHCHNVRHLLTCHQHHLVR